MRIALIVATIGRVDKLAGLLESLNEQTHRPVQIIVSDQSGGSDIDALVRKWAERLPISRVLSSGGLSRARNAGLQALEAGWDAVGFPDDDVLYKRNTLEYVASALAPAFVHGVSGRFVDASGGTSRLSFGSTARVIGAHNVWSQAIEGALFLSKQLVDAVGEFDMDLGVGAATPWQSAEGTDYILRALKDGFNLIYQPQIEVVDNIEGPGVQSMAKVRAYARGTGYVTRQHYGPLWRARIVVRPLIGGGLALMRGDAVAANRHWQNAVGRVEGLAGRVLYDVQYSAS